MALIPFAANLWQLIALFFIRALGTSISMPGSAALYVGIGKKQGMGSTIALMGMATSIGLAAGPVLSGVVAQFTEIRAVFFFAAGLGFLGTTTFAILSSLEPSEPITPAKQVENDASDGLP